MSRSSSRMRCTQAMVFWASARRLDREDVVVLVLEVAGLVGAQAGERRRDRRRLEADGRHVLEIHGVGHGRSRTLRDIRRRGFTIPATGHSARWCRQSGAAACSSASRSDGRQLDVATAMFSSRWSRLDVPGISRMASSCARSHANPTWAACTPTRSATRTHGGIVGDLGQAREGGAEREVGDVGDPGLVAPVEHGLVVAVEQAEGVLHAHDVGQRDGRVDLVERGGRDPHAVDLAFVAQRDHLGQLVLERDRRDIPPGRRPAPMSRRLTAPRRSTSRVRRLSSTPARSSAGVCAGCQPPCCVTGRADLRDEEQVLRVGVQGLVDELVGHVGPVVLGGVDVVDPQLDRAAQHGERRVAVPGRTQHARTGELHGAEADPTDGPASERAAEGERCRSRRHRRRPTAADDTGVSAVALRARRSSRHPGVLVRWGPDATGPRGRR